MTPLQSDWFHDVVSALAHSLASPHAQSPELAPPYNDLTQFILAQRGQLPDYLRTPMRLLASGFDWSGLLHGGKRFHRQSPEQRARQIHAWKSSNLGFQRDLIRYFESLASFSLYSRDAERCHPVEGMNRPLTEADPSMELRAEIVVVGSGP